jgi:N-acetylneuraminate synthase
MRAGEVLTTDNLRIVRPGFGLPPKYFEIMLGKRINSDAAAGTPLSWDLLA